MDRLPFPARSLIILLFGLCPLLFFTDLTRNPYYTQIALLNIFVCALWLFWIGQGVRKGELVWTKTMLDVPLAALTLWSFSTWLISMVQHRVLWKPIYSEGSRAVIFLLVNAVLVYAAAVRVTAWDRLERGLRFSRKLLWIVYAVAVAASVYGVAQYFGVEWIWPKTLNPYGSRPVATFGNPNFMSSYLAMVIPVMAADHLFKCTGLPRVILLAGMMTAFAALLATLTRSSWAGLAVGLGVLLVQVRSLEAIRKEAARWLIAMILGLGLLVLFWPKSGGQAYSATVIDRITEMKNFRHTNYNPVWQRVLIWLSAASMSADHPIIGKGWGCFELFYPYYQGRHLSSPRLRHRTHANNCHNIVLEYLSQIGWAGVGLVVWLWIVYFRSASSVNRRLEGPWKPLQAGLVAGVAAMLVDNVLNVSVFFAVPAFLFWWWVGLSLALDPQAVARMTLAKRPFGRHLLAGIAGLFLLLGIVRAYAFWRAEIYFFEGFKRSKVGELQRARKALESSYAWHPFEVNNAYELGNVYARLGLKSEAIDMLGRAMDANPGYDEIFFNRATVFMQMGNDEAAIRHYQICLAINPQSKDAYNALAGLYLKDIPRWGDATEALYQQGLRMFPDERDFWNNLGWFYTQRDQWLKAQEAYQQALAVDPNFELARRNLAVVNERLRQMLKAR